MLGMRESLYKTLKDYQSALATLHATTIVFGADHNPAFVDGVMHLAGEDVDPIRAVLEADTETLNHLYANVKGLLDSVPSQPADRFFVSEELS